MSFATRWDTKRTLFVFSFPLPFPHLDISVIYAEKVLMTYTHCMHWLADIVTEHI